MCAHLAGFQLHQWEGWSQMPPGSGGVSPLPLGGGGGGMGVGWEVGPRDPQNLGVWVASEREEVPRTSPGPSGRLGPSWPGEPSP